MTFTRYDATKILDDLKLLAKAIQVVADENNDQKRQFAKGLAINIATRLENDVEEMTHGFIQPEEYEGTGKLEE